VYRTPALLHGTVISTRFRVNVGFEFYSYSFFQLIKLKIRSCSFPFFSSWSSAISYLSVSVLSIPLGIQFFLKLAEELTILRPNCRFLGILNLSFTFEFSFRLREINVSLTIWLCRLNFSHSSYLLPILFNDFSAPSDELVLERPSESQRKRGRFYFLNPKDGTLPWAFETLHHRALSLALLLSE
jgi:hypothetical protein